MAVQHRRGNRSTMRLDVGGSVDDGCGEMNAKMRSKRMDRGQTAILSNVQSRAK
jgi:hypothetical protein